MTLSASSIDAASAPDYSYALRIRWKESLRKIETRLAEITVQDDLTKEVTEWMRKLQLDMRTNGDLYSIIAAYSAQLVTLLEYNSTLKIPFNRIGAAQRLAESLIYFIKTYDCVSIPPQLEELYRKILEVKKSTQFTEERDRAIQAIQAKQEQVNRAQQHAGNRPPRLPSKVHTLQTIKERIERETLENMRKFRELEQQLTPENIPEVLETLNGLQVQNKNINSYTEEQIASILNQESHQSTFSIVESNDEDETRMDLEFFDRLKILEMEREQEKRQVIANKRKQMQSRIDAKMPEMLAPMNHTRQLNDKVAAVLTIELEKIDKEDEKKAKELNEAIGTLNEEMLELKKRNVVIARRLDDSQQELSQLEKENLRKQMAYNEAKRALKKQQKRGLKTLVKTTVIVGACAAVSCGVGVAFGVGAALVPYASGAGVVVSLGDKSGKK